MIPSGLVQAAGAVTNIETRDTAGSPSRYNVGNTSVLWGQGNNRLLEAFIVNDLRHTAVRTADRIEIRRVDRSTTATGEPCSVYAASLDGSQLNLAPDFPQLTGNDDNCDMAAILADFHVNRGSLNLFSNRPPTAKNIERVDFIFNTAANAPFDVGSLTLAGHLVSDKSGNNPVQMAAILSLDGSAVPAAYGPLVRISSAGCVNPILCFGITPFIQRFTFFHSNSISPQGPPVPFTSFTEYAAFAFVSARTLGLAPGQRYYGLSLFPADVDIEHHDLFEPGSFPDDTEDANRNAGDSVDVSGGSAGLYLADTASIVLGRLSCDTSSTGVTTSIKDALIRLHVDANENGILDNGESAVVGEPVVTLGDGSFQLIGVADGSYLLDVERPDTAQSPANVLTSANPMPFVVSGSGATTLEIVFDCDDPALAPAARDDSFTLTQPSLGVEVGTTILDVLANDLDPLGQGLQIVAVNGPDNGSLEIVENSKALSYTPLPGKNGLDTFRYTLEDIAGRRDTGNVNVTINLIFTTASGNPVCVPGGPVGSCVIETEVSGHGFGRLGGISLLVLLLWTGERLRRQSSGVQTP